MNVTAMDTDEDIDLRCEMSAYIRPDEHLEWFRDGQIIVSGANRRVVSYTDGTLMGQNGEIRVGFSRVSVLTISRPTMADSGPYTCSVMGTSQSVSISLQVTTSKFSMTVEYENSGVLYKL